MKELVIEAALENIDTVMDFVNSHLENCPPKIRNKIEIAVDEIFSNIARYAYHQETGGVVIRVTADNDVIIEFEDSGVVHDPLAKDDPDVSLPPEKRKAGGLGIFMVKNMMDSVTYMRDGNKNILTIKKRLAK